MARGARIFAASRCVMRPSLRFLISPAVQCAVLIFLLTSLSCPSVSQAQTAFGSGVKQQPLSITRARLHDSDQWLDIQRHLPDPATASPKMLEQQADILRARRFPEDA